MVIITSLIISTISSQPISTVFGAKADVGFQDGLSDCQTGTSDALNGHSNAGHHSAAYMDAYNQGLTSCSNSGSSDASGSSSSDASGSSSSDASGSSSSDASGSSSSDASPSFSTSSTSSPNWLLTVNLVQTQFGTSSATVNLKGPFGYQDSQTTSTGPSPSVTFTVPSSQVPDGNKYQVCVSSSIVSAVLPTCQFFNHGSGDETVTMNIPG